ncbi:MAG: mercuric reductase [Planctomycetota bacterium]|jgi:pyruvate/2-oxoglutarate dehydrogenase complex dihydrolipoamide dehydrogenase (E3) component
MSYLDALQPEDEHNQRLAANVHPTDWQNPTPDGRYNLVVIGAGAGGLVSSAIAAAVGAKVALIERGLLGGDCLNVGCVPSKGVISAARMAAAVKEAREFGVEVPEGSRVDFTAVMERMRRLRADISPADSAARFRDLGVDVYIGGGRFTGADTIEVDGQTLRFKKAIIATGGRAQAPPIPGLDQVRYLTNETVFSLTELPRRIGIIGAGPIGCELAQSFARLGSEVFLVEATHGILPREDPDAAEIVKAALLNDGVNLLCCGRSTQVHSAGEHIRLTLDSHGNAYDETVDELLVAVGRAPNVEGLGLETVGVDYDTTGGVKVNDKLQTANPRIFAVGDVCSRFKFTHASDFMARRAIQNALFFGRAKASDLIIPWCTYTSPELAHVGIASKEAEDRGIAIDTYTQELADVDRAILDGETDGFVRVHTAKGTDHILGATIVARNAGDMISEITLAMRNGIGLSKIADTIHPYPTQADAIRKAGDLYNRTRLTPGRKRLLAKLFSLLR